MTANPLRMTAAILACLFIFFGASTRTWWMTRVDSDTTEVGLADAIRCGEQGCNKVSLASLGDFSLAPALTRGACAFAFIACVLFLMAGHQLDRNPLGRLMILLAVIPIVPLCFVCLFFFSPGTSATLGIGIGVTLVGGGLAFYAVVPTAARKEHRAQLLTSQKELADDELIRKKRVSQQSIRETLMSHHTAMHRTRETIDPTAALVSGMGLARRRRPTTRRVPNADLDTARRTLRFVAASCQIGEDGLDIIGSNGNSRILRWSDIEQINARRLPPDPPFFGAMFIDLVIAGEAPVRIFGTTRTNYGYLQGGAAHRSTDNLSRLANFVEKHHSQSVIEPESAPFFYQQSQAKQFPSIKHFVDYDEQFVEVHDKAQSQKCKMI